MCLIARGSRLPSDPIHEQFRRGRLDSIGSAIPLAPPSSFVAPSSYYRLKPTSSRPDLEPGENDHMISGMSAPPTPATATAAGGIPPSPSTDSFQAQASQRTPGVRPRNDVSPEELRASYTGIKSARADLKRLNNEVETLQAAVFEDIAHARNLKGQSEKRAHLLCT